MSGVEGVVVEQWIYEKLANDSALTALCPGGIHEGLAPHGATLPAVVYQNVSPLLDTGAFPAARSLSEGSWSVRVIGAASSYVGLAPAAKRVDELLHGKYGNTTGGTINGCVRTEVVQYGEETGSSSYRHLGGIYKLSVS